MTDSPEKIGRYLIRRTIGEGAMSRVLEGFDPHIERRVAIKQLHPHLISGDTKEAFLQRFRQEARIAARCIHPNIVTLLEYGEYQNAPYIVMEYVDGVSLQEIMQKKRIKLLKSAISYIGQTLKALSVAHAGGVIHRDIKPANIIVRQNGSIKLSDFGIAGLPVDNDAARIGLVVGTPRYMSPEQAMARPADQCSDLYSLTMVFAQMLTHLVIPSSVPTQVLPKIKGLAKTHYINNKVPVPTAFIPIIIKGLAFDPGERIQTAREYHTRLKSAVRALELKNSTTRSSALDTDLTTTLKNRDASPVDKKALETMHTLLSGYIGPIACNVIQSEAAHHRESTTLAYAVAAEIPDRSDRQNFIKNWQQALAQHTLVRQKIPIKRSDLDVRTSITNYLVGVDIEKLEKTFTQYVGPMAGRLIELHRGECRTFSLFIDALAAEIPDENDKQAFFFQWHDALS